MSAFLPLSQETQTVCRPLRHHAGMATVRMSCGGTPLSIASIVAVASGCPGSTKVIAPSLETEPVTSTAVSPPGSQTDTAGVNGLVVYTPMQ